MDQDAIAHNQALRLSRLSVSSATVERVAVRDDGEIGSATRYIEHAIAPWLATGRVAA